MSNNTATEKLLETIKPMLAEQGITVTLPSYRQWMGAVHCAFELQTFGGNPHRIHLTVLDTMIDPPIAFPENPFGDSMDSYDHNELARAQIYNAATRGLTYAEVEASQRDYEERVAILARELAGRFQHEEDQEKVIRSLVDTTDEDRETLVAVVKARGRLEIPNGDLINRKGISSFLDEVEQRASFVPFLHPFLPYARLQRMNLIKINSFGFGPVYAAITNQGYLAYRLLEENAALHVLARFGHMFHDEMRKKYPQMNRETKVTDIRLPKPTPPSWRHIEPGVGEVVLRFEEWRSSAGELFRVAYVPETNTVYMPITSDQNAARMSEAITK